jgi:hypothetical protein
LLLTAVNELGGDLPLNLSVSVIGYADASWLGNTFEPGRNVHTVAKDVFAFDEHITQVDANAE